MTHRGIDLNLENFKSEVHRTLMSKLDLEKLSRVNSSQARQAVSSIINEIISDRRVPLSFDEQEKIQTDLLDEVFGLGPLEPLLKDQKISDILVNDKDHVFIERGGLLTRADASFRDDRHLLADHRPHRFARRTARRRILANGRCAPARRIACQCHHSASRARRAFTVDPPFWHRSFGREPAGSIEEHLRRDDGTAFGRGARAPQHPDLRRYRRR